MDWNEILLKVYIVTWIGHTSGHGVFISATLSFVKIIINIILLYTMNMRRLEKLFYWAFFCMWRRQLLKRFVLQFLCNSWDCYGDTTFKDVVDSSDRNGVKESKEELEWLQSKNDRIIIVRVMFHLSLYRYNIW